MKLTGTHFNSGVANGNTHVQTLFRPGHGVSLHPLQRLGLVPSTSHNVFPSMGAAGPGDWNKAPAAGTVLNTGRPRVLPMPGSPHDPAMQI